jgi:hypothetical protein
MSFLYTQAALTVQVRAPHPVARIASWSGRNIACGCNAIVKLICRLTRTVTFS